MSRGKGGPPKVFSVACADRKERKVIARSPKAARMIVERAGYKVDRGLDRRTAIFETAFDPKNTTDALNFAVPS